jgi:hypothetical protein
MSYPHNKRYSPVARTPATHRSKLASKSKPFFQVGSLYITWKIFNRQEQIEERAIITACKLFIVKFMVVWKGKSGVVRIKCALLYTFTFLNRIGKGLLVGCGVAHGKG